jgi:hypothetical protein
VKSFTVRLVIPTYVWANVLIDARSEEEAIKIAFEENKKGDISYEYAGFDNADVELDSVDEAS